MTSQSWTFRNWATLVPSSLLAPLSPWSIIVIRLPLRNTRSVPWPGIVFVVSRILFDRSFAFHRPASGLAYSAPATSVSGGWTSRDSGTTIGPGTRRPQTRGRTDAVVSRFTRLLTRRRFAIGRGFLKSTSGLDRAMLLLTTWFRWEARVQ